MLLYIFLCLKDYSELESLPECQRRSRQKPQTPVDTSNFRNLGKTQISQRRRIHYYWGYFWKFPMKSNGDLLIGLSWVPLYLMYNMRCLYLGNTECHCFKHWVKFSEQGRYGTCFVVVYVPWEETVTKKQNRTTTKKKPKTWDKEIRQYETFIRAMMKIKQGNTLAGGCYSRACERWGWLGLEPQAVAMQMRNRWGVEWD